MTKLGTGAQGTSHHAVTKRGLFTQHLQKERESKRERKERERDEEKEREIRVSEMKELRGNKREGVGFTCSLSLSFRS